VRVNQEIIKFVIETTTGLKRQLFKCAFDFFKLREDAGETWAFYRMENNEDSGFINGTRVVGNAVISKFKSDYPQYLENFIMGISLKNNAKELCNTFLNTKNSFDKEQNCLLLHHCNRLTEDDDLSQLGLKKFIANLVYFAIINEFPLDWDSPAAQNTDNNATKADISSEMQQENGENSSDSYEIESKSKISATEFNLLPDYLLNTLHLMFYVTQQQAPSKKELKLGGNVEFVNCTFSRYAFIAACDYFDASNDIKAYLMADTKAIMQNISECSNKSIKNLFLKQIEINIDGFNRHQTFHFIFNNPLETFALLKQEMEYRKMSDMFDFSDNDVILDKKTATQKKVWTVLLDIFHNCKDEFHNCNDIYKFELNSTLSKYLYAISFDEFPKTNPENKAMVIDGIQTMLLKRNYHQSYFMILVEFRLGTDELILHFEYEEDRLKIICQVASLMFEDESDSYISGFWQKTVEYLNKTHEKPSTALQKLIAGCCMDGFVWSTYLSKFPAKNAGNIRFLISKCIEKHKADKLITTLCFFDKQEYYKYIFDSYDSNYNINLIRFLKKIIICEKEINRNQAKKTIDLLKVVETPEKIKKLLKDRRLDKNKNFPDDFLRYLGEETVLPTISIEKKEIDTLFAPKTFRFRLLQDKVEKDKALFSNNYFRSNLKKKLVAYKNGVVHNNAARKLCIQFLATQENYYEISDLITMWFDYAIIKQTDKAFFDIWKDFVEKIKQLSVNPSVKEKLKSEHYKSLIEHIEQISSREEFAAYLNELLYFSIQQAVSIENLDPENMFFVLCYLFNKKIGLDNVYCELIANSDASMKYENGIKKLCKHLYEHINLQSLQIYMEKLVSHLLFHERFITLSLSLRNQLIHYAKKLPEFVSEYRTVEDYLSSPEVWSDLEDSIRMAIISRASDAFLDSHPCVKDYAAFTLGNLNTKKPNKSILENTYGYKVRNLYYHLISVNRHNPIQSARLCCFVLSEVFSSLDEMNHGNTFPLRTDFELKTFFCKSMHKAMCLFNCTIILRKDYKLQPRNTRNVLL